MTKKEPTAAQLEARRKFGERARARAAERKAAIKESLEATEVIPTEAPTEEKQGLVTDYTTDQLDTLIAELQARGLLQPSQQPVNQYQSRNITKFSINPKDYPDPRPRLFEEDRLKIKNFTPHWFIVEWKVSKVEYDRDNIHYVEPRFEVELWRIKENEAGEPSNKKFRVATGIFFEDPDSFIQIANAKGIDVPENLTKEFADELRYITIRDWLFECFYPALPDQTNAKRTEETINNRVVEVVEMNSVDPVNMMGKIQSKI